MVTQRAHGSQRRSTRLVGCWMLAAHPVLVLVTCTVLAVLQEYVTAGRRHHTLGSVTPQQAGSRHCPLGSGCSTCRHTCAGVAALLEDRAPAVCSQHVSTWSRLEQWHVPCRVAALEAELCDMVRQAAAQDAAIVDLKAQLEVWCLTLFSVQGKP